MGRRIIAMLLIGSGLALIGCGTALPQPESPPRDSWLVWPELLSPPRVPAARDRTETALVHYELETLPISSGMPGH